MKTTVLPSSTEIIARLRKVNPASEFDSFYAEFSAQQGRELTASGLATMFSLAVSDCVKGGGMIATITRELIPPWINALVDEVTIAREANQLIQKAMSSVSGEDSLVLPIENPNHARLLLIEWIRDKGYKGSINIFQCLGFRQDKNGLYFPFDVLEPCGAFDVYANGTVNDAYKFFG